MKFLFWNAETKELVGIYFQNTRNSIKEEEEYHTEIINRGFEVSSKKYNKGKLIREWS